MSFLDNLIINLFSRLVVFASSRIQAAIIRQHKRDEIKKSVEGLKNAKTKEEFDKGADSAMDEF